MKQQSKLSSEQQQQQTAEQQAQQQQQNGMAFETPEHMLRYDAANTTVPASVAERLQQSVGSNVPPRRSWWQRFFGGTNQ
jgi:hypothetical protein